MLVIGSNKIDLWLSAFFSLLTKLWCRVTGKTNVALAYVLLGCGIGLAIPRLLVGAWADPWELVAVVFWGYIFRDAWGKLRHIEWHIADRSVPPDVIPIPPQCILELCRWRQWWVLVAVLSAALPPYDLVDFGYAFGLLLAAMSLYVVLHVDMGWCWRKDSLRARAKGWLRRHAPSLGPVLPAPAPA